MLIEVMLAHVCANASIEYNRYFYKNGIPKCEPKNREIRPIKCASCGAPLPTFLRCSYCNTEHKVAST